jgi:hypothetical protein
MLRPTGARRGLVLTALVATSALMALSGATTARADFGQPPPPPSADAKADGQVITVSVWGNGSKSGSAGSGQDGRVQVSVPAPCWMTANFTGREYFEYVDSGQMARDAFHANETVTPYPGYEQYRDDHLGYWYGAMCSSANWPGQDDPAGFNTFALQFFEAHPSVYVPANEQVPQPPVPPALLRDIAFRNLRLPDPRLDWNPKRAGSQGTLVNLDTWFWLDSAPTTLTVNAAAGGNEATVTARFGGMTITAPGESPLSCDGPGTRYTAGADSTCALRFGRASSALGAETTPVTVATRWTGTWAANGVDQGPLTRQPDPLTGMADIRVDEVQTLVTSSR